jgi:hypothetical protein
MYVKIIASFTGADFCALLYLFAYLERCSLAWGGFSNKSLWFESEERIALTDRISCSYFPEGFWYPRGLSPIPPIQAAPKPAFLSAVWG